MKNLFSMMIQGKDRPKIKLRLNSADWLTEIVAVVFLILLIGITVYHIGELPEKVPVHFNAAGEIDGYGSKITLMILPLSGTIMYILLTAISPFPHIFNFPVKITPENARVQYILATRMLRILKTVILIMFTTISYQTIRAAEGITGGLGKIFLPVFLVTIFGVVIIYMAKALNNRSDLLFRTKDTKN